MAAIVSVRELNKTYKSGFSALRNVSLEIEEGEVLALLGPNGAGKTTLISAICGVVTPSSGQVMVAGHDIQRDFRAARSMIGLVPQELTLEMFETVMNTARFSRGLFGRKRNDAFLDAVLKTLALDDKRDVPIGRLSGGMKRRVMIAKALSHEPRVLFLDEPTAGVDVELRKGMWETMRQLKASGVTIILTTHHIEEAEAMADRIAIINRGEIGLVEETGALMSRLGRKQMLIELQEPVGDLPASLAEFGLTRGADANLLVYTYDIQGERTGITRLLSALQAAGLALRDVQTRQSSLEDIFVDLVRKDAA